MVAAIGIVFNKDRTSVLLVKRRDIPVWVLPGGGIDIDETPEKAAIREVLEESGLSTSIERRVGTYTPLNRLSELTHVFVCKNPTGSLRLSSESKDVRYFPVAELPKLLPPPHKAWIEQAQKRVDPVTESVPNATYSLLVKALMKHPVIIVRFLLTKVGIHINT